MTRGSLVFVAIMAVLFLSGSCNSPNAVVAAKAAGCNVDADCMDSEFCNGAESCVANLCQAGTPPDCTDGISCTVDQCNEATDSCDHVDDGTCGAAPPGNIQIDTQPEKNQPQSEL